MRDLEKRYSDRRKALIKKRSLKVEKMFNDLFNEIYSILSTTDLKNPKSFSWSKHATLERRIDTAIGSIKTKLESHIKESQVMSWNLANMKNNELVLQYLANIQMNDPEIRKPFLQTNLGALKEFVNRTQDGMNLSTRVWNIGDGVKNQLETYLGNGIATGQSAKSLATDVKQFLNEPDKLFRRVRDANGNLKLSKPAKAYHPGRGVYRSSSKNALRLTRSETNIAYNMSDYTRRQQLSFVVGIEVKLSASHPERDICDDLKGKYPKDYVYKGWHTHCLCYTTSILLSREEFLKYLKDGSVPDKKLIKEMPQGMIGWLQENRERILLMRTKPYFVQDNSLVKAVLKHDPVGYMKNAKISAPEVEALTDKYKAKYKGFASEVNLKQKDSILRKSKTDYGGDMGKITDLVRSTIVVEKRNLEKVFQDFSNDKNFIKVKRFRHAEQEMGYDGILATFKTSNGVVAEIQAMSPEMMYAKQGKQSVVDIIGEKRYHSIKNKTGLEAGMGHKYYEAARILDKIKDAEMIKEICRKSKEYYSFFM
jgi:hypothetical protein